MIRNSKNTNGTIKLKSIALSCILSIVGFYSAGQQYDLFQVLDYGKKNYSMIKAKEAEAKSASRKVTSSRTEYLPSLIAQHQYTYSTNNNVTGSFFPNEGTALAPSGGIRPDNIYTGTFGSFTSAILDWKIVNFGKVAANVNVAKSELNRTNLDYENELFQYQVRLSDAYLLLLISHKLTLLQQSNLRRAELYKDVVEASVRSGLKPGVDSSLAHAEYAKARLLLLESERNETSRQLELFELLGGMQESIQVDSMEFFHSIPLDTEVSRNSLSKTPALRLYQSVIDLSKARSVAIRRSFYPSISLGGATWARGSGISNQDDSYHTDWASGTHYQVYNYMVGLSLRWNITNYVKIRNEYKSETYQTERFAHHYKNFAVRQERQLKESEIQLRLMLEQTKLAPVQLQAARSAFEQAQARYEHGLSDLPTLTQSLVTLNRAEADQYIAFSNAWRSLLMKSASSGDFSLFLEQVKHN